MYHSTLSIRLPDFVKEIHNGEFLLAMDNIYNPTTTEILLQCLTNGYPLTETLLCWKSSLDFKLCIDAQSRYTSKYKKYIVSGSTTAYLLYKMLESSKPKQVNVSYSTSAYPEMNKLFKYIELSKTTAEFIPLCYMLSEENFKMWETNFKPSVTQLMVAKKFRTKIYDTIIPITLLKTDNFKQVVDAIPGRLTPTLVTRRI